MFSEEQLLPISALQHFAFCPRRAALIFTEGQWADNQFTAEGTILHERADDATQSQNLADVRIERAVGLCSYRHGLTGKADVIEFHKTDQEHVFQLHIIEYKRGKPKHRLDLPFQIQLCGQALCIEDMLGYSVTRASIFYGKARHRKEVDLSDTLRSTTLATIEAIHALVASQKTPLPDYQPRKCRRCSLFELCLPHAPRPVATASRYLQQLLQSDLDSLD